MTWSIGGKDLLLFIQFASAFIERFYEDKDKQNIISKIESTNETTHKFEGSVGLIILILTYFNLSNTYLGFKNCHITRTFLLPAATAVYWKINALPAGNRPEITVSWQSRLDTRFSKFSRIEVREPSFEDRFEFRDTLRIFRGSRTQNNSNEQNSRRAALFLQTCCWMYANIFSCCAISTRHTRFAYLHWSWWQQSLASKCVYNVSCQSECLFLSIFYNPERVCCFHLCDFNRPLKT